jgi:hypothetical protein
MSRPTNEPLGDAAALPSTTKDVNIKDSPRRYGKRPKKLHQPITSTARELRQLVNRQDQLLRLMRESLKLQNPVTGEGVEPRPHDPDPDELADNEKFAKSFHVDVTLDSVALKESMEETVNLFFTAFQIEGLGCYSRNFESIVHPTSFRMWWPQSRVANALTSGSHEKPILLLGGVGDNGSEVINIQWGQFDQQESGEAAIEATKLAWVLRSKWRESLLLESRKYPHNYEIKLLNYDMDRDPKFLDKKVYSQHFLMSK